MSKEFQNNELSLKHAGLLLDSPSILAELPDFEILFGAGEHGLPDWEKLLPAFRYQGSSMWCTAFMGTSLGSTLNKLENGQAEIFSAIELFYRSGGQQNGNSLLSTLLAMRDGLVLEHDMPTPVPDSWGTAAYNRFKRMATATAEMRERGKPFAIKNPVNVPVTPALMRAALSKSPLGIAIGIGSGYWNERAPNPKKISAYHAVLLIDIEPDGSYKIFDSLTYKQGFNGIHYLAPDYDIIYALGAVDLPNDWYDIQQGKKRQDFSFALSHYGKQRMFTLELEKADAYKTILRNHPTLLGLSGKYWTVIVNALAYGGYSYVDILNHLTHIRRTGEPIFDLNQVRA